MSGVAGVFHRRDPLVDVADVHRMLDTMAHRGPDGAAIWAQASVGFGHRMLLTTPESLSERQPLFDSSTGLCITADARIDNRDELIAHFSPRKPRAEITDSELILAAYTKWGESCPEHLLGDFAFAIWDQHQQRLFCASDPMGVKTFYYVATPQLFAFASEIKALWCLPDLAPRLNELRVADHLMGTFAGDGSTFFRDVVRLLPASTLAVTSLAFRMRRYWSPGDAREIRFQSDDQYADAFCDIFEEAVRSRTRSAFPVGSTLSGGLDSSSVACVARNIVSQPVHTFSLIFPSLPEEDLRVIDERRYITAVVGTGGFDSHLVRADQLSPLGRSAQIHHHLDEANGAPNLYLHWGMFDAAREHGVRVLLDGFDGDSAVSHGFDRLTDLTRDLHWRALSCELSWLAQHQQAGMGRRYLATELCVKPLIPGWAAASWNRLRHRPSDPLDHLLNPSFARRVESKARMHRLDREPGRWTTSSRQRHADSLRRPIYAHTLAVADRASAAFGVEARYPFFDRRLIEFCVGIPGDQKLGQGWSRLVLRRGMRGVLPDVVRWRKGKGDLSPNFRRGLLTTDRVTLDRAVEHSAGSLRSYVDPAVLVDMNRRFRAEPAASGSAPIALFSMANLALWLDRTGVLP